MGEGREDRSIVEVMEELITVIGALVDLLSNPITVNIVDAQAGVPTTIILTPGVPRHN